eukprot:TRINITY_DN6582_c0_g1_i1.p1 TRINITY_DN6582_c0_g1~~TRINITY_DN6582_c0_g1_i1.p1  ORF type:complete len:353 (+),score=21.61 TRINITY_DN6582_c0_g1_i1:85-1059(+)
MLFQRFQRLQRLPNTPNQKNPTLTSRNLKVQACNTVSPKHVVITGGNTGIGFETALQLASKNFEITLVCRNTQKAETAKLTILKEVPSANISILEMSLDSFKSISNASKMLLDDEKQIDVLINNAGVLAVPYQKTVDGLEYQQGVNHFGHFLFTQLLLPKMKENDRGARIVNLSSMGHLYGQIDFQNLMYEKGEYTPWRAYFRSKLENVLFTYELARKLRGSPKITVNCVHPGLIGSEIWRHTFPSYMPFRQQALGMMTGLMKTSKQGAETSVYLASSPDVEGVSSKYFVDCQPQASSYSSYDTNAAKQLWLASEELTKCEVYV